MKPSLVIFGVSNILSDVFDCALANGLDIAKVVRDLPEETGERDKSVAERIAALAPLGQYPGVEDLDEFQPQDGELYILGPTTPTRAALASKLERLFGLTFATLVHPTAFVSPLASLSPGVFVGSNSVIGPGARLAPHVFINRGVTVGHDTQIGAFSRLQPGSNVGGLSVYGRGVTIGIGATVIERVIIGDNAFVGAGAVALSDIPPNVLVVGIPAKVIKTLKANDALAG